MRYGRPKSISMASLTQGIATLSFVAALVATSGCSHLLATSRFATCVAAETLATVTSAADVERLGAPYAVRPAVAVVVAFARDRNLRPGGAGRAALGRRDFCWIPASLLGATGGGCFAIFPLAASSSRLGSSILLRFTPPELALRDRTKALATRLSERIRAKRST